MCECRQPNADDLNQAALELYSAASCMENRTEDSELNDFLFSMSECLGRPESFVTAGHIQIATAFLIELLLNFAKRDAPTREHGDFHDSINEYLAQRLRVQADQVRTEAEQQTGR